MGMKDLNAWRQMAADVEVRAADLAGRERDHPRFRQPRPARGEESDLVPQFRQAPRQPHHVVLGTPMRRDRKTAMDEKRDMHGSNMPARRPDRKDSG
jgi:hypothetical protein